MDCYGNEKCTKTNFLLIKENHIGKPWPEMEGHYSDTCRLARIKGMINNCNNRINLLQLDLEKDTEKRKR